MLVQYVMLGAGVYLESIYISVFYYLSCILP